MNGHLGNIDIHSFESGFGNVLSVTSYVLISTNLTAIGLSSTIQIDEWK